MMQITTSGILICGTVYDLAFVSVEAYKFKQRMIDRRGGNGKLALL